MFGPHFHGPHFGCHHHHFHHHHGPFFFPFFGLGIIGRLIGFVFGIIMVIVAFAFIVGLGALMF